MFWLLAADFFDNVGVLNGPWLQWLQNGTPEGDFLGKGGIPKVGRPPSAPVWEHVAIDSQVLATCEK